jgi:hypothetical protein
MNERKQALLNYITNELREHPDWLHDVVAAATYGVEMHLLDMRDRYTKLDRSFLLALALASNKRITKKNREWINDLICESIKPKESLCPIEKDYLKENDNK